MRTIILKGGQVIYEKETSQVVLPGLDGEFSIMSFHQPLLYRLRKGIVKIAEREDDPKLKYLQVRDGLAKFDRNTLVILCEK
ncbi:MAG: hypothetical protein ABH844_03805 [Candidatus Omnitrophota bacterium]